VEVLKTLSHKNIVQYYGTTKGRKCLNIFLEYISGSWL